MTLNAKLPMTAKVRKVGGITEEQRIEIQAFLQGAVYSWCKNRPDEWFCVSDLFGGANYDWYGTPLMTLYQKHITSGKTNDSAIKQAAKDCGHSIKKVIAQDKRIFDGRVTTN